MESIHLEMYLSIISTHYILIILLKSPPTSYFHWTKKLFFFWGRVLFVHRFQIFIKIYTNFGKFIIPKKYIQYTLYMKK